MLTKISVNFGERAKHLSRYVPLGPRSVIDEGIPATLDAGGSYSAGGRTVAAVHLILREVIHGVIKCAKVQTAGVRG